MELILNRTDLEDLIKEYVNGVFDFSGKDIIISFYKDYDRLAIDEELITVIVSVEGADD